MNDVVPSGDIPPVGENEVTLYLMGELDAERVLEIRTLAQDDPELAAEIQVIAMMTGDASERSLLTAEQTQFVDRADDALTRFEAIAANIRMLSIDQRNRLEQIVIAMEQLAADVGIEE